MNANKFILTLSLMATITLHAMDRRNVRQTQESSYCQQLQQATQKASAAARQTAVGCCIIAPFVSLVAITSGAIAYGVCSCVRADHEKDASIVALVAVTATITSGAIITCMSMNQRYQGEKLKQS